MKEKVNLSPRCSLGGTPIMFWPEKWKNDKRHDFEKFILNEKSLRKKKHALKKCVFDSGSNNIVTSTKTTKAIGFITTIESKSMPSSKSRSWNEKN
jgi:hypothetical protein